VSFKEKYAKGAHAESSHLPYWSKGPDRGEVKTKSSHYSANGRDAKIKVGLCRRLTKVKKKKKKKKKQISEVRRLRWEARLPKGKRRTIISGKSSMNTC